MNHLLEQLKLKPKIEPFQKVQVMIPGKNINKESRTLIVDERDKGYDRDAFMKKRMERNVNKISVQKNMVPQGEPEQIEKQEREKQPTEEPKKIEARKKRLVLIGEEERKMEQERE